MVFPFFFSSFLVVFSFPLLSFSSDICSIFFASPSSGERSLEWIASWPKPFSDADGNGFLRYCGTVPTGAKQFGWLRYYCAPEGSGFPSEA
jgi:hypothetical protein